MVGNKGFACVRGLFAILCLSSLIGWRFDAHAGTYSDGTGEPNAPYRIATAEDMNEIGAHPNDWDKHFVLVTDINMGGYSESQFNIIGSFSGVFDGNGHTISSFTYEDPRDYAGLLIEVRGADAVVKDLTLIDPHVIGGSLFNRLSRGKIHNCHVEGGSISGSGWVGGLVGRNIDGTISECSVRRTSVSGSSETGGLLGQNVGRGAVYNCNSSAMVAGQTRTGGLVGNNYRGTISDCLVTGLVTGVGDNTGGLVGSTQYGTVTRCRAEADVTGTNMVGGLAGYANTNIVSSHASGSVTGVNRVGGLIGECWDALSNCFARGSVDGNDRIGGLAGWNAGDLSNCYATGPVAGNDRVGGLIGDHPWGYVLHCYAAGHVTGETNSGGLTGRYTGCVDGCYYVKSFWDSTVNPSVEGIGNWINPNVIWASTVQMQQEDTFTEAGWDFVEVWDIGENQTYPFLQQNIAGDLNHDGLVDGRDFAILAAHWLENAVP